MQFCVSGFEFLVRCGVGVHAKARLPLQGDFSSGLYIVATGRHDIVNFYNMNFSAGHIESKFDDLMTKYGLAVRVRLFSPPHSPLFIFCDCV